MRARDVMGLALTATLLATGCADDDATVSADGTANTIPVTTTSAISQEDMGRMVAACDAASKDIEAPHEWISTTVWSVADVDRDLAPAAAIAAWEDLDPSTRIGKCSYELHECEDPLAISAYQHIFITDYTRVDFAELQATDCDVYPQEMRLDSERPGT